MPLRRLTLAICLLCVSARAQDDASQDPKAAAAAALKKAVATRMQRGAERYKARKYDDAIEEFTAALALDPAHTDALVQRGHCHYQKRDWAAAIADYDAAIAIVPNHGGALYNKAVALQQLKEHAAAVKVLDAVVRIYETWPDAYLKRGFSKRELLDFAGAVEDFGIAIYHKRDMRDAYVARAKVNEDLGNYEAAVNDYTSLIEQDRASEGASRVPDAKRAEPLRERARCYFFLEKKSKCWDDFKSALFLSDKDPATWQLRGRIKKLAGDHDGAIEDCTKAIEIDPKAGNPYFVRGLIHYDFEDYRRALLDLSKSIRRTTTYEPDYIWLYHCLTRMQLKQKERGQKELKEYVASKKEEPRPWFATVAKFLVGEIDEDTFLAAAKDDTPKTTAERQCEAFFYAGTVRMASGDRDGAVELFKRSVATRVRSFIEYESSVIELRRAG